METTYGTVEFTLINDDIEWIKAVICEISYVAPTVEWYLFGSVTKSTSNSDIDILVVYENASQVEAINNTIAIYNRQRPIDLIYMTSDEEQQLEFIRSEGCEKISLIDR